MLSKVFVFVVIVVATLCIIVFLLDWWKRRSIFKLLTSLTPTDNELGQALSKMPFKDNACFLTEFVISRWSSRDEITVTKRYDRHTTVVNLTKKNGQWQAIGPCHSRAELVSEIRGWCDKFVKLG